MGGSGPMTIYHLPLTICKQANHVRRSIELWKLWSGFQLVQGWLEVLIVVFLNPARLSREAPGGAMQWQGEGLCGLRTKESAHAQQRTPNRGPERPLPDIASLVRPPPKDSVGRGEVLAIPGNHERNERCEKSQSLSQIDFWFKDK